MVKAKDFWKYLCEELDYRFFAGVACPGLLPLYKKMDSKIMHYVPAANERIALGMVTGAQLAGLKGAVLLDIKFMYDLTSMFSFNIEHRIPLLIIGYNSEEREDLLVHDFPMAFIVDDSFKADVSQVVSRSEAEEVPGLIVFEKGVL